MNPFRRFLPPAALLFLVTACNGPDIGFDQDLPVSNGPLQAHLQWESPAVLEDLTASVGTPSGEFELTKGTVMFDGSEVMSGAGSYAVSFWAVQGQTRYVKLALDGMPIVTFTVPDEGLRAHPDGSPIAKGDSVRITMELDNSNLAVHMSPSGLQFDEKHTAILSMWYDLANDDFNNDGVVDKYDAYIEANLLGMWYRQTELDDWSRIESETVGTERRVSAPIRHFSGYVVSW